MDGNPAIFEQVVSFAGAVGAAPFPVSIPMPTNFKGCWTYSDTLLARLVMAYHAWTTAVNDAHLFMFVPWPMCRFSCAFLAISKQAVDGHSMFQMFPSMLCPKE
eukprot:g5200.t1